MTWIETLCEWSKSGTQFSGSNQLRKIGLSGIKDLFHSHNHGDEWECFLDELDALSNKPFAIVENSVFSYNIWTKVATIAPLATSEELDFLEQSNQFSIKQQIKFEIETLSPSAFEDFVVDLIRHTNKYDRVSLSPKTRDGGVDFRAFFTDEMGRRSRVLGEVKKWSTPVSESVIDRLASSMEREKLRTGDEIQGVLVTLEGVSPIAQRTAKYQNIEVWDRETLIRLVTQKKIGVKTYLVEVPDDDYWGEYSGL